MLCVICTLDSCLLHCAQTTNTRQHKHASLILLFSVSLPPIGQQGGHADGGEPPHQRQCVSSDAPGSTPLPSSMAPGAGHLQETAAHVDAEMEDVVQPGARP